MHELRSAFGQSSSCFKSLFMELLNKGFYTSTEEELLEDFEAAVSLEDDAIADLIQNFQDLSSV